jgi:hypothetical protein
LTEQIVGPLPPDPNSRALMFGEVDPLPPQWRELVHEYGLRIVQAIRAESSSIEEAKVMLKHWRTMRQRDWLATDYITKRSFRMAR